MQLLAWLAVQAGWRKRDSGGRFAFVTPNGNSLSILLQENAAGPALSSLVLRAGNKTARITQAAGSAHVERRVDAPGYCVSSLSPADPAEPEELVALQLARGGKNSLYQKILPHFRQMLEE